jgi:tripartite-type tricarboxylate transporter receptor subunit TctC
MSRIRSRAFAHVVELPAEPKGDLSVFRSLLCVTLFVASLAPSYAQAGWPERPVTIVSPFAAGGTADFLARLIAEHMQREFKQTFVVENKTGAGGSIGAGLVARAQPDGHTLLLGSVATHAINPLLSKLPLDPLADFEAITLVARLPNLLVVRSSTPVKTVPELVAYLKEHPEKATFGSAGNGTSQHLAGELFRLRTGAAMTHVPYKGASEIMMGLIGGEITLSFNNMVNAWPAAKDGQVRAIAVTSLERNASAPEVPTMAETLPNFEATTWFGLFAPKGTSAQVVERLTASVVTTLAEPEVLKKLNDLGAVAAPLAGEAFTRFLSNEQSKWRQIVEAAGLKQQ